MKKEESKFDGIISGNYNATPEFYKTKLVSDIYLKIKSNEAPSTYDKVVSFCDSDLVHGIILEKPST